MTYRTNRNRAFAPTPFARAAAKHVALSVILLLSLGGLTAMTQEREFPLPIRFGIYVFGGLSIIAVWAAISSNVSDTYHEENQP